MGEPDRPRLSDVEQEVLLSAVEGDDLFHIVWGARTVTRAEASDEELRPEAEAVVRKLIGLGWVRLARAWQDPVPPGERQTVTLPGFGQTVELQTAYREEPIPPEQFDEVLRDPRSWGLTEPSLVILVTTNEGDAAVASGVLAEAYDKIYKKNELRNGPSESLPEPGPPFAVGEHVRFAPTVLSTPEDPAWFKWEEAVILEVDEEAETFAFRFISEPEGVRHAQGMEVIVRVTENYLAWRRAYEEAYARNGDDQAASNATAQLWRRVLAEHPIHGHEVRRGPQKPEPPS